MPIYETHFDPETKEITRHSEICDYEDMDDVILMEGEPVVDKPTYQVHEGGKLFSTFPWSLPSAAQVTGDTFWGGV